MQAHPCVEGHSTTVSTKVRSRRSHAQMGARGLTKRRAKGRRRSKRRPVNAQSLNSLRAMKTSRPNSMNATPRKTKDKVKSAGSPRSSEMPNSA
jgi:hypothetical protein